MERIKVDAELIELARSDVREAMRKEILINQNVIDTHPMNRRTPRFIKETMFYAMARNNAINHFLELSNPTPENLRDNVPCNENYKDMMNRAGASKYPLQIKSKAEWDLYYNYTCEDYKRKRHFLDSPLPEKPKARKVSEYILTMIGLIIITGIRFWWVFLILIIGWGSFSSYSEPGSYSNTSTGNNNAFSAGGISGGNSTSKHVPDSPQVKDDLAQSGFGNGGVSGNDVTNSVAEKVKDNTTSTKAEEVKNQTEKEENSKNEDAHLIGNNSSSKSNIESLIPEGWHLLKSEGKQFEARDDLNKDEIEDIALIIEKEKNESEETPSRSLLIAFGKESDDYSVSIISNKAILKSNEGGVWGDPLKDISIDRGSVVLNFYGGSNYRWYAKYRFRFQDNDWYLIGATLGSYNSGRVTPENANEEDYNLLTGEYVIKDTNEEDPNKSETIRGKRGKTALLLLKDFDVRKGKDQFLK